jgi:hypothetical protein
VRKPLFDESRANDHHDRLTYRFDILAGLGEVKFESLHHGLVGDQGAFFRTQQTLGQIIRITDRLVRLAGA